MALSLKQTQSWIASTQRDHFTLWSGAIRSGKTIISLIAFLSWLKTAPPGPIAVIGKTKTTIIRNVLDVIAMLEPRSIGSYGLTSERVRIMGRWVWLISANDAQAEAKLRGLTLAGAYVDEVTLIPEAMFVQLLGRLSVSGARLFATTNPDSPAHWLKTGYIDRIRELPGWGYWPFTMDDNPGLTPEYIAAKKKEFTGLWYRRFIQGAWVSAEGAVYDMWDPDRHVVPWDELPKMQRLLGTGVDFGTTNASAALMLGLGVDGVLYLVDEWRTNRAADADGVQAATLTNAQQATGLTTWLKNGNHTPDDDGQLPRFIYIDPAAASFKAELYQAGWHNVTDAQNDVLPGISLIASGLSAGWLKVSDRCRGFISEAPGYSWDPKAQAAGIDKPIKTADHSLDGGRYAIASTEHMWRPIINRLLLEGAYK